MPMTLDHGILSGFLDVLKSEWPGMAPPGKCHRSCGKAPARQRCKIKGCRLLTDGRSNAGKLSPLKAAEVAEPGHQDLHGGAGARGQPPSSVRPLRNAAGIPGRRYRRRNLTQIASSRGSYFRAEDVEGLRELKRSMPLSALRSSHWATSNTTSISIGS